MKSVKNVSSNVDIKKTWKSILIAAGSSGEKEKHLVISIIGVKDTVVDTLVKYLLETLKEDYPVDANEKLKIHLHHHLGEDYTKKIIEAELVQEPTK